MQQPITMPAWFMKLPVKRTALVQAVAVDPFTKQAL
jgi:hypothetical protein